MSEHEHDAPAAAGLAVDHRLLSDDALRGVVEAFVLREGTDYGDVALTLEQKVEQVLAQVRGGEAGIVFDPDTESVDIVAPAPAPRRRE